jgi:lactoylglutathione lyase
MSSVGQFCINVSDLERAVAFYSDTLGLKVEHRLELPDVHEAILVGDDGVAKIQLAKQLNNDDPIEHGNGFWKLYIGCDDCQAMFDKAVAAGAEGVTEPMHLEQWHVTIAFIKDHDGYLIELMQSHA